MEKSKIKYALLSVALLLVLWFAYKSFYSDRATVNLENTSGELALTVSKDILGKWQSVTDTKFTREFKSDGIVEDDYGGEFKLTDKWRVFSEKENIKVAFPLEPNISYLEFSNGKEQLYFKIIKITSEDLELVYMDRGGVLQFKKIK